MNHTKTRVFCSSLREFLPQFWQNIRVGDIIKVQVDEQIPCDILLLCTSNSDNELGGCYVDSKSLDGETNLKSRNANSSLQTQIHPISYCPCPLSDQVVLSNQRANNNVKVRPETDDDVDDMNDNTGDINDPTFAAFSQPQQEKNASSPQEQNNNNDNNNTSTNKNNATNGVAAISPREEQQRQAKVTRVLELLENFIIRVGAPTEHIHLFSASYVLKNQRETGLFLNNTILRY